MIPTTNNLLTIDLEENIQPSKNYKMNFEEKFINGYRNELDAMQQVIYKILNTERYEYIIYSWNYGVELKDLYGEPISYVIPEIERRITEALIQDERIASVDSFSFDYSKNGTILVKFKVHTIFGDIDEEKVVNY